MAEPVLPAESNAALPSVLFVSLMSGWRYAANVVVGALVCAAMGGFLGLATDRPRTGMIVGALVPIAGALVQRRRLARTIRLVERGVPPAALFLQQLDGTSFSLERSAVVSVSTEALGDADAVQLHRVRLARSEGEPIVLDARDATDAEQLAQRLRAVFELTARGEPGPSAAASAPRPSSD